MQMHQPTIEFHGPAAVHDMACAVCRENKAIYQCNEGVFLPCWGCQSNGFQLLYAPILFKIIRLLGSYK